MSYTTILAEIKEELSAASGIGTVHDYERWCNNQADFETLYKSGSTINGWTITRSNSLQDWDAAQHVWRNYTFVVRGYYSLDDSAATEKTFQALIDSVMNGFDTKVTWEGTATLGGPSQLMIQEHRMFFGHLCHYCEIELRISDYLLVTVNDTAN